MKLIVAVMVVLLMFFSATIAESPSGLVVEDALSEQTSEEPVTTEVQHVNSQNVEDIEQPANEDKEQSFLRALFSLKSEEEQQELFSLVEKYKQVGAEEALKAGIEQADIFVLEE